MILVRSWPNDTKLPVLAVYLLQCNMPLLLFLPVATEAEQNEFTGGPSSVVRLPTFGAEALLEFFLISLSDNSRAQCTSA